MKCPLREVHMQTAVDKWDWVSADCLQAECAWWNDRFGMCSPAVDAYLKGQVDYHNEIRAERKGG